MLMLVIAFAGRRVDAPDADVPRLPPASTDAVRERLRLLFAEHDADALVCAGACGSDLLALDAAGTLGMRRRLVLPFDRTRFRATSVTDRADELTDWGALFDEIVEGLPPDDVVELDGEASGDEAYAVANRAILDEAEALAGDGSVRAVIAWEGTPRGEGDLTAAFAEEARARGIPAEEVRTHPAVW
jgi:hypothetical protein